MDKLIKRYTSNCDYPNAIFYSLLNHTEMHDADSLLLLAQSYFFACEFRQCFQVLLNKHSLKTIVYFAKSAINIGKSVDAEVALLEYQSASEPLALLASICRHSNRHDEAIRYYKRVIQLDKHNYSAYRALSEMASPIQPSSNLAPMSLIVQSIINILNKHKYKQAIASLRSLNMKLSDSILIRLLIARAHYESGDYDLACQDYREIHKREPWCMEGMELYSTALWYLGKEIELSYLGQALLDIDRKKEQAWCATGNCFSLKKEHGNALKCFARALQINPNHAYSHTLSGHESLSNEDYDAALASFRNAVRIDPNHYNAWYGLGQLYQRQERYDLAEQHYDMAIKCRPDPKLYCFKAIVAGKLERYDDALDCFEMAIGKSQPTDANANPWFFYQRAQVLFKLERYEEALDQLEAIKDIWHETNVYFLIARVYKKLGMISEAIDAFCNAQDYIGGSQRAAALIKDAMEKVQDGQDVQGNDGFRVLFV